MTKRNIFVPLAFALAAATATAVAADVPADDAAGTRLSIPANVQATAAVGVVLRVKEVVAAEDVTLVTVSASYSGETSFLELAYSDSGTYLQDEDGQKYPLRSPQDNPNLRISRGDTMQGRLVFLGRVAPESKKIRLVFNEGRDGGDTSGPGLSVDVPLTPKG
jgi:hypothetical protein